MAPVPRAIGRLLPSPAVVTRGVLTLPAIRDQVTITRDRWHVPHIGAASAVDAWFGLGFCQGQDRTFQLDTTVRAARGELAALLGRRALPVDRLTRRLGFHRRAVDALRGIDPASRQVLDAFAAGLRAGATTGRTGRPLELRLLRRDPLPVGPADVLAVFQLVTFLLAGNWETELARLAVLVADGEQALRDLDPRAGEELPVTVPVGHGAGPATQRLAADLAVLRGHLPLAAASNNWALRGTKTASGAPLLGNDMHLPPSIPGQWYLAHLTTPGWSVAGAALVGTPGIAAGHNGHVAWGMTAGHTDTTDLFLEQLDTTPDGVRVRDGDDWVPAAVHHERIAVRGGEDVVEEVVETPRGPVIGPGLDGAPDALSVRGTWMVLTTALRGFLALPAARDGAGLRAAFDGFPMQLNVVWAAADGSIGWQLVGTLPARRTGSGALPLPGWLPEVGWHPEPVPYAAMPHTEDPVLGFVATANNPPVPDAEDGPELGGDFLDAYRLAAIDETLHARDDWDVPATLGLQLDDRSLPWRDLQPLLARAPADDPDVAMALELLAGWDGHVAVDAVGASVFELTVAGLARRVVAARAPRAGHALLGASFSPLQATSIVGTRTVSTVVRLLRQRPAGWFEQGWDAVTAEALGDAVRELRRRAGADPDRWGWGRLRTITFSHLLDELPGLRAVLDRGPYPLGGDTNTIAQAWVDPRDPLGNPGAVATVRLAVDLGDLAASRFCLAGGQSGEPTSPHYDDQLAHWRVGEAIAIPWTDDELADAATGTLRLLPHWEAP